MRVCVIADEGRLGARIRRALVAVGPGVPGAPRSSAPDEAEAHLVRDRPEVVVAATGRGGRGGGRDDRAAPRPDARVPARGRARSPTRSSSCASSGAGPPTTWTRTAVETELAAGPGAPPVRPGRRARPRAGSSPCSPPAAAAARAWSPRTSPWRWPRRHERSLLIDLKPRSGDLAAMLDLKPSHTMQDLCRVADADRPRPVRADAHRARLGRQPAGLAPQLRAPRSRPRRSARVLDLGRALFPRIDRRRRPRPARRGDRRPSAWPTRSCW